MGYTTAHLISMNKLALTSLHAIEYH